MKGIPYGLTIHPSHYNQYDDGPSARGFVKTPLLADPHRKSRPRNGWSCWSDDTAVKTSIQDTFRGGLSKV